MAEHRSSEAIKRSFEAFTRTVAALPLYHRLSSAIVDDAPVRDLLLEARPGQDRPVLLFAAVHDLLLRRPELDAARWYPSITPASELASGDPYPAFRATCLDHADELREVIATHSTQTNEVNRCVLLAPMVATALADVPDRPVALVELGCSAGLLLGLDRYRIEVGGTVVGDAHSPVSLAGAVDGGGRPPSAPFPPTPPVVARVGIDLHPVALDDPDRVRWLEACLWPDQPWRLTRFRAAVALMRADLARLVTGDLIAALPAVIEDLPAEAHVVVYHCWAVTYVERSRRAELVDTLGRLAGGRSALSWLSAEPPGAVPGITAPVLPTSPEEADPSTVLGLRRWRDGHELEALTVGWGHPHGDHLTWAT